jgi:hypothetical protein
MTPVEISRKTDEGEEVVAVVADEGGTKVVGLEREKGGGPFVRVIPLSRTKACILTGVYNSEEVAAETRLLKGCVDSESPELNLGGGFSARWVPEDGE